MNLCNTCNSIPVPPQVLIRDKYFSEFKTDYEKAMARKNLGITSNGTGGTFGTWKYLDD